MLNEELGSGDSLQAVRAHLAPALAFGDSLQGVRAHLAPALASGPGFLGTMSQRLRDHASPVNS